MNKLYMLVGLPSSGKSTIAEKLKNDGAKVHSSDAIREELFNDINSQLDNDLVFNTLHNRVKTDLKNGLDVVFDACNINAKKRMAFLNSIKNVECDKIAVLLARPYEDCLSSNSQRDRVVPEEAITRMYKNFNIPQLYEGFNDIQIVWNYDKNKFNSDELWERLGKLNQDNPYHTLTVGGHCTKCCTNIVSSIKNIIPNFEELGKELNVPALIMASLYHDIGKEFTKEYNEAKGYSTYYQHHLVSAYLTLFYLKNRSDNKEYDNDILAVCNYIQHHMQPFFLNTEKSVNKFVSLVGETFYKGVLVLHDADVKAK